MAAAERNLIPELDGLRAIAIIAVLVTHFWTQPADWPLANLLARSGWAGVDLFFVLSGYLITGILWDARSAPRYYRNFYARRALRIFPLYYALLLIVFALLPLVRPSAALEAVSSQWPLYALYLANFTLAVNGWSLFLLDITWSLSVEEQFYLVWPAIVRNLDARAMLWLCAMLIVSAPILRSILMLAADFNWRWAYMMTPLRADSLAWGAALAVVMRERLVNMRTVRRVALVVLGALSPVLAFLVLSGRFYRDSVLVGTIGYSLIALASTSLLVVALEPGALSRAVLGSRPLRHIGKVSYGMYILHPLCLMLGGTALGALGLTATASSDLLGAVGHLVALIGLTWAVATASFRLFEQPLLRLKDRFTNDGMHRAPWIRGSAVASTPWFDRGSVESYDDRLPQPVRETGWRLDP